MGDGGEAPSGDDAPPPAARSSVGLAAGAAVAAPAGDSGAAAAQGGGPRRRRGQQEVQEVVDELAQETKRTALLERVEQQLKGRPHVARILFGFGIADDKKTQSLVEHEFSAWREKQEKQAEDLSGLLLFTTHGALHFLEGPTDLLFGALELFHGLGADAKPAAGGAAATAGTPADAKPALIGAVRVLHFTELHGVRASGAWCSFVHGGKLNPGTQAQLEEATCSDFLFRSYQKLLTVCLRVREQAGEGADQSSLQTSYKKASDMMPTVDEVYTLLSKSGADFFFSYAEFEKVFIAPFNLVLHSELLWPMPPPLSY